MNLCFSFFQAGDEIRVLRIVNSEWLYGECSLSSGQFPAAYVDRIPDNLTHQLNQQEQEQIPQEQEQIPQAQEQGTEVSIRSRLL